MAKSDNRWNCLSGWGLVLVVVTAGVMLFSATLMAGEGVVVITIDGRQISGELVEQGKEEIVLDIAGIRTRLQRDEVASVETQPAPEEVYRQRRAELEDDDIVGRVALVRELMAMGAYDLARNELVDLQKQFPENAALERLANTIDARERLDQQTAKVQDSAEEDVEDSQHRLTAEQINRIRVYEVDLNTRPRVQVPQETLDKLFVRYADAEQVPSDPAARARIRRAPGHEQLAMLFAVKARELYDDVNVPQDPPAIRGFRSQIHRQYVLNFCSTTQCHGSEQAVGDFRLWRKHGGTESTVYSNFLLLSEYENDHGKMINRTEPEQSLLLQYGVARAAAAQPHPEVRGWRPRFRTVDDPRFQRYAQIIDQFYEPKPDYGIDYAPWSEDESRPKADEAEQSHEGGTGGTGSIGGEGD